ncbi:MAG: acylneuraminate cytidylyltransferase family protein [Bacteroidetes bacterium]|nr:MAG: acylneuraminate cytidylyltransferase family protein [Bacteroidota bacterium]
MNNILITICARGGSKGIPKKNIKTVGEHPLIYYSIKIAQRFLENKKGTLVLSTDDDEIKEVGEKYGLFNDYKRPLQLATDTAGKVDAIRDILLYEENRTGVKFDLILDLDVTSPLRTLEDLEEAFQLLRADTNALNLFSVSPANRNPYFNMVEKKGKYFGKVKDDFKILSRQKAPEVYDMNASFYYYTRAFFEENYDSVFTDRSLIYEVPHICFDLDENIDFEFMNYLFNENKLEFNIT